MPRKGENIYKRKDGRWEGRYIRERTPTGKARYGYVYAPSYREAKVKLHAAASSKTETLYRRKSLNGLNCVKDAAADWLTVILPQVKESTGVKYKNLLEAYILPTLGEMKLINVTQDCIEEYCNHLLLTGGAKGTGLSPKTVADILSVLRSIFRYSSKSGNVLSFDMNAIRVRQVPQKMRVLSRSEQDRLCQYLNMNLTLRNIGILISLYTGLRIGEICALQWEDISLCEHTIHVHRTMQRIQTFSETENKTRIIVTTPKSQCSVRIIPLPEEMVHLLSSLQGSRTGYFLTGSEQKYVEPRTMQNHFRKILKECLIAPANYHSLRHTFATRCVEVGFDMKSLSEILGHASVNITMNRYVHPSMELKRENMQRLSTLFAVK